MNRLSLLQKMAMTNVQLLEFTFKVSNRRGDYRENVAIEAAKEGHLFIIQWMYANHIYTGDPCLIAAAEYGHINILDWLHNNRSDGKYLQCTVESLWENAIKNNHLPVIDWLRKKKLVPRLTTRYTAYTGNVETLEYLIKLGYYCNVGACKRIMSQSCAVEMGASNDSTKVLHKWTKYSEYLDRIASIPSL